MLRLHDTAIGTVKELQLREPGHLSMYVCGPTVYGEPHIGHGRFSLVWDVIRRYLAWTGLDVRYVSNVTDIDDKIIDRANTEGRSAAEVATQYETVWFEAMDRLGVARPSEKPHATEYVDQMIELVGDLVERGRAYQGGDGVYFAVETVEDYGLLIHQALDSLKVGARVEVGEEAGKRSPLDFVLWKAAKPDEPSWDSPWGPGRPGWHTECVVMSLDLLGEDFDLHGGGIDLAFPHHENERAQAVGSGHCFARHWTHSGHVMGEGGVKMSKSLGNVVSLPELLREHDPRAYRLLVLQSHYRSPMTVSAVTMRSAEQGMKRLDALARRFPDMGGTVEPDHDALVRFRGWMDEDLNTVAATADLFDLVTRANSLGDHGRPDEAVPLAAAVREITGAVGLEIGGPAAAVDPESLKLAASRDEARSQRDYAAADSIRSQLEADGYVVEDTANGTVIRRPTGRP